MLALVRLSRRPVLGCTFGALALGWLPFASAQTSTAPGPDQVIEGKDTRAWLMRFHDAPKQRSYAGTFVFSSGGAMSSARVAHYCEGGNQYERIDSLDGPPRQVLRHNDVVHTVWPQSRVVVVEQRDSRSVFPALLLNADDQIFVNYEVRAKGTERVAGHDANVIHLKPRDGYRYGYRLWSDISSGLLLRADVLGERNEVLESSAFSDVAIGIKAQPELVLAAMKKLDGYRVIKSRMTPARLDEQGWVMRASVPGFRQLSCFKRPLDEVSAKAAEQQPALQVVYSDGLTHVSLFIEPFDGGRHGRPSLSVSGATRTFSRRHKDWWITAVGDVPLSTLRLFSEGLDRNK